MLPKSEHLTIVVGELANFREKVGSPKLDDGVKSVFEGAEYAIFCHGGTSSFGK